MNSYIYGGGSDNDEFSETESTRKKINEWKGKKGLCILLMKVY